MIIIMQLIIIVIDLIVNHLDELVVSRVIVYQGRKFREFIRVKIKNKSDTPVLSLLREENCFDWVSSKLSFLLLPSHFLIVRS